MNNKILKEIINDSKIMSKEKLISKYKNRGIEIKYHKNKPGFITFNDKSNKETVDIQELNKYFDEIDNWLDNLSVEEFDQVLINAGIENCPYEE